MSKIPQPSPIVLNLGSFFVILTWAYLGVTIAEYLLVDLFQKISIWFLSSYLLESTMLIAIGAICWWVKSRWNMQGVSWNFRRREVEIDEYVEIHNEYMKAYAWFINYISIRGSIAMAFLLILIPLTPLFLRFYDIFVFSYAPAVFGLLLIGLGIISIRIIYSAIPNTSSQEFKIPSLKSVKNALEILKVINEISWVGVALRIGEFEGIYVIAEARPIGRVLGFESVIGVEIAIDEDGNSTHARTIDMSELSGTDKGKTLIENSDVATKSISHLITRSTVKFSRLHGYDKDALDFAKDIDRFQDEE